MAKAWKGAGALVICAVCAVGCKRERGLPISSGVPLARDEAARAPARAPRVTPEQLLAKYPAPNHQRLDYDPRSAKGMASIQQSPLRLATEELAVLAHEGLVIATERTPSSFALGYLDVYTADLPVFISADAILHAFHRAYGALLIQVEMQMLVPALREYLVRVRHGLARSSASPAVLAEVDVHLTVAASLLADEALKPANGGSADRVKQLFDLAKAAEETQITFFGERSTDLTQFKPRGHYEKQPALQPYFRAMMWLGQIDFRWIETLPDGSHKFSRRQVEGSVAIREAMSASDVALYRAIDRTIEAFVGERDAASPPQVDAFLKDLGLKRAADLAQVSDARLIDVITHRGHGKKRIQGDFAAKYRGVPELETNSSFAVFPRRYTLDSHTFHAVTEDRVPERQLPSSLDIGFATLGNDFAAQLAAAEINKYGYSGELVEMREFVDARNEEYWQSSLYTLWLSALRALSKTEDASGLLPRSARTSGWARRIVSTQLASWGELRHDTLLYAEQSYSVSILCEFTDVYVEPYPELFARLRQAADLGLRVIDELKAAAPSSLGNSTFEAPRSYFKSARATYEQLERMARRQRRGERPSPAELAFANHMIDSREDGVGCGARTTYDGWYKDLFYTADMLDPDLTIADVHTSGEEGILHVAKSAPRRLVVTIDDGSGPRAFAGVAYAHHELTSGSRLTVSEWRDRAHSEPDEPWMLPVLAPRRAATPQH